MVILNIIPALGSTPRPDDDAAATPAYPSSSALERVWSSTLSLFFPRPTTPSGNAVKSESHILPPSPEQQRIGRALEFLKKEVRPLIAQGRLHDLAEVLRSHTQHPDSSDRMAAKMSQGLLSCMPDWIMSDHLHLSDKAMECASHLRCYLTGDAAGAPLAAGRTRFGAIASLIDAYMIDQFPSGIELVSHARHLDIPAVLATRHHTLGGGAVPAIAELLRSIGAANGQVSSHYPTICCPNSSADIFWEAYKNSVDIWTHSFNRLRDKGLRQDASIIMVVDDNLSNDVKDAIREAFCDTILKAYVDNDPRVTQRYKLKLCRSAEAARSFLDNGQIAGLVSDLFSPRLQTEESGAQFRKYFQDICAAINVPPGAHITELLDDIDAEKRRALSQIVRAFNGMFRALRQTRNTPMLPTAESLSKEKPQS